MQDEQLHQLLEDVWETVLKLDFHYDRIHIGTTLTQVGLRVLKQELHPDDFTQLLHLIQTTKDQLLPPPKIYT